MLKNNTITLKFTLVFIVSILLVGFAYFLLLRNVYESQLLNQARTTADHVEAFGAWVSKHGRLWAKDDPSSFLGELRVVEAASLNSGTPKTAVFYSKNPALAQREFSEAVAASESHARFRMTSDNFMNPLNKPDAFEARAINIVKLERVDEYAQLIGSTYRYARAVIHEESCISCHGSPDAAPREVTAKYGALNGFGFKAGDVAGVISVELPAEPLSATFFRLIGPVEIGLVALAFLIAYLYIRVGIVRPVQELTDIANKLSTGQDEAVLKKDVSQKSRNEIDQLRLSVNRLRNSIQIAIRHMREKNKG
jgi:HAMP domain-containing protein